MIKVKILFTQIPIKYFFDVIRSHEVGHCETINTNYFTRRKKEKVFKASELNIGHIVTKMVFVTGTFLSDLVAVIVILVAICIAYVKWTFRYWENKGVVTLPPVFPFGNAKDIFLQKATFGEHLAKFVKELKPKGIKHCGFYFIFSRNWMVIDPDLIKSILTKDFMHFTDHGNYNNEEIDPLSGQLFMLKGMKWKNMRVKLTPTFTSGKMKMMFPILMDCSKELMVVMDDVAKSGEGIDIKDVVARFTTDIIGSCAFGLECNTLKNPDSEFRVYTKKVFETGPREAFKNFIVTTMPWVVDAFKIPFFKKEVTEFFMKMVDETVSYREKNSIIRKDFLHLLIQLKNNVKIGKGDAAGTLKNDFILNQIGDSKPLTMNELTAQAFVFFLAGFETSSTTLTFCLYELVSNIDVQEKLREEIDEVLEKYDGKLTYEALNDLTYMEKCINETLRKYPPLPIILRECTKTYKVPDSDVIIEKGTRVFIPILGIQRDPEYYPDPEKFDPERFSPEQKAERHPFTWLPFGDGPRICLGLRFGMMQTKVALAVLLHRYKFSLNSKTVTPLVMDPKCFIMSTMGGIWLNVEKNERKRG